LTEETNFQVEVLLVDGPFPVVDLPIKDP
jgi:hypothetical protein